MALTTSIITGRVPLPTDDAPTAAEVVFTLSHFDTEGVATIPPAQVRAVLDSNGELPEGFVLWRNTEGSRGTTYIVTALWSERSRGMGFIPREQPLGKIQIGDADSYSLAELLDATPPDVPVTGWFKAASAAEVQEIKDAADALSGFTAPGYLADVEAGVAATAADVVTTGENVGMAQLAAAQAAMYGPLTFPSIAALFASSAVTTAMIGKRAGTQDGSAAWDIVAAGAGHRNHPVTGVGLNIVPINGRYPGAALGLPTDGTGNWAALLAVLNPLGPIDFPDGQIAIGGFDTRSPVDWTGAGKGRTVFVVASGALNLFNITGANGGLNIQDATVDEAGSSVMRTSASVHATFKLIDAYPLRFERVKGTGGWTNWLQHDWSSPTAAMLERHGGEVIDCEFDQEAAYDAEGADIDGFFNFNTSYQGMRFARSKWRKLCGNRVRAFVYPFELGVRGNVPSRGFVLEDCELDHAKRASDGQASGCYYRGHGLWLIRDKVHNSGQTSVDIQRHFDITGAPVTSIGNIIDSSDYSADNGFTSSSEAMIILRNAEAVIINPQIDCDASENIGVTLKWGGSLRMEGGNIYNPRFDGVRVDCTGGIEKAKIRSVIVDGTKIHVTNSSYARVRIQCSDDSTDLVNVDYARIRNVSPNPASSVNDVRLTYANGGAGLTLPIAVSILDYNNERSGGLLFDTAVARYLGDAVVDGQITASGFDVSSRRTRAVIASETSRATGTIATVIGSTNSRADGTRSVILGSRRVINSEAGVIAGGDAASGDPLTANRKWTLNSVNGNVAIAGTLSQSAAFSDFAEMFPNAVLGVIPVGSIVALEGDAVRQAQEGDRIAGVISATAAIVAGDTPFEWQGRHLSDEFGRPVMSEIPDPDWEGDGEPPMIQAHAVSPNWDDQTPQIPRSQRPEEWSIVGLIGRVFVRVCDGVQPGDAVAPGENGVGKRSDAATGLRCLVITAPYNQEDGFAVARCLISVVA